MNTDPSTKDRIVDQVVTYYLGSRDFNGLPATRLTEELGLPWESLRVELRQLILSLSLTIASTDWQGHPHIRMFEAPIGSQVASVVSGEPSSICVYPTGQSVEARLDVSNYDDRLFTRAVVLGAPQLSALSFSLDILDSYKGDPRYTFYDYDFGGRIGFSEQSEHQLSEDDRISIRFGVGYDEADNRVVAVYLTDLRSLPPRQQRLWKEYMVDGECRMNEDYFRTTILAEFPEHTSPYEAFIYEQVEINRLATLIRKPPLFRKTFEENNRPRDFGFFVKPTRGQYTAFVQLLDKMLSDNLNYDFFKGDIDEFRLIQIEEGVQERQRKGSIALLEEWLTARFTMDPEESRELVGPLRDVRAQRQSPAHSIVTDEWDPMFHKMQDNLVTRAYRCLRGLRKLLATDPGASSYKPPERLETARIKNY